MDPERDQDWQAGYLVASEARAAALRFREAKSIAGKKGGRPKSTGLPEVNHSLTYGEPKPQNHIETPNGVSGARVRKKAVKKANGDQSLEEILQGRDSKTWERYWKLIGLWDASKNPAPKRTAHAFVKVMEKFKGRELAIYYAACAYQERFVPPARATDETRFMKNVLTWLEEEAWENEPQAIREAMEELHAS